MIARPARLQALALSFAVALVILRSGVWLVWEHAYFDADQAVTGLMAKHLAEGRAFPLFFYGQHYMLAVEAWLAAPLFAAVGPSVAALKLPLLGLNIAVAVLLVRLLVGDAGLRRSEALIAAAFFVIAPPVTASRLLEAQGGNIEPLLYVLALWIVRRRPVWFGLVAGFGFLNREFTAYGVAAILVVEMRERSLLTRRNARDKAIAAAAFAAVWIVVQLVKPYADLLGPNTSSAELARAGTNVDLLLSRFSSDPSAWWGNIHWLLVDNLPSLFGLRTIPFSAFITSRLDMWSGPLYWPFMALMAAAAGRVAFWQAREAWRRKAGGGRQEAGGRRQEAGGRRQEAGGTRQEAGGGRQQAGGGEREATFFLAYLALVGMQAFIVYTFFSGDVRSSVLIRYTLLGLYLPIAIVAALLRFDTSRAVRTGTVAVVVFWGAIAIVDHLRLLEEYAARTPPNAVRQLVEYLREGGYRYGGADYWTAYYADFLSGETIVIASREKVRVQEYQATVDQHAREAVEIWREPGFCDPSVRVGLWYLCPPR